ncbi:glycosyltransferase [Clostridium sp. Mt-5]|uniref:Glycosyltransferase n=1 Tax=Clostridium moutaii TaxID=3240932 RepID=A0ABV4BJ82_9CLOT
MISEKKYFPSTIHLFQNIAILIPAFNPDDKLVILIKELIELGVENIIVVDDGSKKQCSYIFKNIKKFSQCNVIEHAVNLGKGRALKTGVNYFLNNYKKFIGLITVDADGQHKCEDIIKVAKCLKENQHSLILGTRNFNKGMPFRSWFGNLITAKIFTFFSGINISDTQTGLRGIPYNYLPFMLKVSGEKYEFEMNVLLECSQRDIYIKEVAIKTIYIEKNKSSHFNPLLDSIRIYVVFLKFIFSSFASFFVDMSSFIVLTKLFLILIPGYFIILSTIGSRIISSAFNYIINNKTVFCLQNTNRNSIIRYYILATVQMLLSALGVSLIYNQIHQGEVFIKIIVDLMLFFGSFKVQRNWVFKLE